MNNLNTKAWLGLIFLALAMGLLLFLTAGTVRYRHAWAYLAVYFGASFFSTLYLMKKDPGLLKRRLKVISTGPYAFVRHPIVCGRVAVIYRHAPCACALTGDFCHSESRCLLSYGGFWMRRSFSQRTCRGMWSIAQRSAGG